MSKELRISASLPLPAAFSERAALMAKISPSVAAFEEALGVPVHVHDVTVKGPRAAAVVPEVREPPLDGPPPELASSDIPVFGFSVYSAPDHPAIETKRRR